MYCTFQFRLTRHNFQGGGNLPLLCLFALMINFLYQNRVTAQMPCGQTGCNINCFDDFEDFTPETGGYYMQQNIVPPILVTVPSLSGKHGGYMGKWQ